MSDVNNLSDIRNSLTNIVEAQRDTRNEMFRISGAIERDVRGDIKVASVAAEKIAEKQHDKITTRLDTITLMVLGSNIAFLLLLIFSVVLQLWSK